MARGFVDGYQSGVFQFCKKITGSVGFGCLSSSAQLGDACGVVHVASQAVVSLDTLGLGAT